MTVPKRRIENELSTPLAQYGQINGARNTQGVGTKTDELIVCSKATDEDEARELLACLGLLRRI